VSEQTLRRKLLKWLLVPLGVLWSLDAASTWARTRTTVNASFDRALHASALAIAERVTLEEGAPAVEIPPVALEVLDTEDQDRLFYAVSYRAGDAPARFLTGYADLPSPKAPAGGAPAFYEVPYRGEIVRIAALQAVVASEPPVAVLVKVGETMVGRDRLVRSIATRELASKLVLVAVAALIVAFGVSRGLRPLLAVSRDVSARSPSDLTPVALQGVPDEVSPLVLAVNSLMTRVSRTLAAQRRFIADASHALRTPLTVLRTEAEVALMEGGGVDQLRAALSRVRDQSAAATHLAMQLLALARAERTAEAPPEDVVDACALARDACAKLVPQAVKAGLDVVFEGDDGALVQGRAWEVRELVENLVDNAIKYGRRGTITVSVAPRAGAVVLAVEDEGPGIPADERPAALAPFGRLGDSSEHGAGLGLAIVGEIARGHRAELRLLYAGSGSGLRVEVVFPPAPPAGSSPAV
jgi:two-component system sensor histidine kinase TctE